MNTTNSISAIKTAYTFDFGNDFKSCVTAILNSGESQELSETLCLKKTKFLCHEDAITPELNCSYEYHKIRVYMGMLSLLCAVFYGTLFKLSVINKIRAWKLYFIILFQFGYDLPGSMFPVLSTLSIFCYVMISSTYPQVDPSRDTLKVLLAITLFVIARNSSKADIEINPGPVPDEISKILTSPKLMCFEKMIAQKLFIQSKNFCVTNVTHERHKYNCCPETFELTTEVLFDYNENCRTIGAKLTDTIMFPSGNAFGFFNSLIKLTLTLTPMSNGGSKLHVRRIFENNASFEKLTAYSQNCKYPFSLPFERGCEVFEYIKVYETFNPNSMVAMLQGATFSNLRDSSSKLGALCDKLDARSNDIERLVDNMTSWSAELKNSLVILLIGLTTASAINYYIMKDQNSFKLTTFGGVCIMFLKGPDIAGKVFSFMDSASKGAEVQGPDRKSVV